MTSTIKIGKLTFKAEKFLIEESKQKFVRGDKIVMNNLKSNYTETVPGVKGIIMSYAYNAKYLVDFPSLAETYTIEQQYMDFQDKKKKAPKPKYEIIYHGSNGNRYKKGAIKVSCDYKTIEQRKKRIKEYKEEMKEVQDDIKIHDILFPAKKK